MNKFSQPTAILTPRVTRRELAYYILFTALALFGLTLLAGLLWYASPRDGLGRFVRVGAVSDFPVSDSPYRVEGRFFVVNVGGQLIVFDNRLYSGDVLRPGCRWRWVPTNDRFEDPCYGSKYSLLGEHLSGSPHDMRQYPYTIRDEQIWVKENLVVYGIPSPTPAP